MRAASLAPGLMIDPVSRNKAEDDRVGHQMSSSGLCVSLQVYAATYTCVLTPHTHIHTKKNEKRKQLTMVINNR